MSEDTTKDESNSKKHFNGQANVKVIAREEVFKMMSDFNKITKDFETNNTTLSDSEKLLVISRSIHGFGVGFTHHFWNAFSIDGYLNEQYENFLATKNKDKK